MTCSLTYKKRDVTSPLNKREKLSRPLLGLHPVVDEGLDACNTYTGRWPGCNIYRAIFIILHWSCTSSVTTVCTTCIVATSFQFRVTLPPPPYHNPNPNPPPQKVAFSITWKSQIIGVVFFLWLSPQGTILYVCSLKWKGQALITSPAWITNCRTRPTDM